MDSTLRSNLSVGLPLDIAVIGRDALKIAVGDPYRRKVPSFTSRFDRELGANLVEAGRVRRDPTPFRTKYDPGNPAADARGEVRMPNVNGLIENMDMREAQRSYEANLNMVTATRRMISRTLEILKA